MNSDVDRVRWDESAAVARQLTRMRTVWVAFLVRVPRARVVGYRVPHLEPAAATPKAVTLVAAAAAMWISFTAERDSRARLERARRAFAVHQDPDRLLRSHLWVFVSVLARLELIIVFGLVTAVWGVGPTVGTWFALLAGLLMLLTWPSEHKVRLVLARGRRVLDDD
jgi:hypothetical protein